MRMSLLDVAFYLLDSAHSPQDFTLILHLRDLPDIDALRAGAQSALNRFPHSGCYIERQKWVWGGEARFEVERATAVAAFIDARFDLRHQIPVKQCIANGACLATRFHHSAADGLSATLWLGHQLNVAYGIEPPQSQRAPFAPLPLRRLQTSVRRSKFAFDRASDSLWPSRSQCSGSRRWLTIRFPALKLQKACRRAGGFTYSDLLATCCLEVLSEWNDCRGGTPWPPVVDEFNGRAATGCRPYNYHPESRIGLWVPMNIRRESNGGFGNGTSRIRIYKRYDKGATLIEKCREVRRQVSWTSKHGEWVMPNISLFTHLPHSITRPFLRRYLNRSSVDMATAVFSHAGSWMANAGEAFKHVERIECIGLLHPRQSLAINAATNAGTTWLTFTFDRHSDDLQQLAQMYQQQIASAQRELF